MPEKGIIVIKKRTFKKLYDNLNKLTQNQESNTAWMMHRAGRITASTFYQVARMKDSESLISTIMQYTEFTLKYTEYGKKMESVAQHFLEEHESRNHSVFSISSSGLVVNADEPYLSVSLDGNVFCQCHGQGILEIKCPY